MLTKEEIYLISIKQFQNSYIEKLMRHYFLLKIHFELDVPMFEKIAEVSAQRLEKIYKKRLMENYLC